MTSPHPRQPWSHIEAMISAVSSPMIAVDTKLNILYFNSELAILFPHSPTPRSTLRLNDLCQHPSILKAFSTAADESTRVQLDIDLPLKDSFRNHFFSVNIAPIRAETGREVQGAIGIFHDITQLKQAEQIRIEFVQNVSHELRTPLTSIRGYVATLQEDLKTGQLAAAPKYMETITRNTDRLLDLVNDLLDLSTLESAAEDFPKIEINTRTVTEHALNQLEERRAVKKHVIDTQYAASNVSGHPTRLEQVLVNLIENAIKYTPEGGNISVIWTDDPQGQTRLTVKDSGPGIPEEHLPRLFERFYRADKTRSRQMGGTGLGLAIVKHIVHRHQGSVSVQSAPGEGTSFFCTFPRV